MSPLEGHVHADCPRCAESKIMPAATPCLRITRCSLCGYTAAAVAFVRAARADRRRRGLEMQHLDEEAWP